MSSGTETVVAEPGVAEPRATVPARPRLVDNAVRFTSNIVGPLLFLRDILSCALAVPIAYFLYELLVGQRLVISVHLFAGTAMVGTFILLRASKDSYLQNLFTISERGDSAVFDALLAGLVATALVFLAGMVDGFSRGMSSLYLVVTVILLGASRPIFRGILNRLARREVIGQRIAFYGADADSIEAIRRVLGTSGLAHLRFVGFADDRPKIREIDAMPFLGGSEDLAGMARKGQVDQVLISVRNLPPERLHEIMDRLSSVCVDISLIPDQAVDLAPDYRVRLLGTLPVLTLWQRPWRDVSGLVKRLEDVVLSTIALILLSPIMLFTALLIRLTSAGPVLFVQPRVGFNNEVIQVYKFRSMYADLTDLVGHQTTTKSDPRITPVGRIIRRLSIDELPQLLNVFKGDMSMVGPRPHATHMRVGDLYYQEAVKGYAGRHRVKPGITGLAQVKGLRGEIRTMDRAKRRVELDQEYINRWSVGLDIWILLLTVRAVFLDSDAY
ncbi:exopolysaccharide biosynthesis polyprenyl glycosylphosphotransferase [Sphingomonas sp. KRR8]|uniref:exopolysaccharide biosynthesis polyprenyl glycosylphosphotransferase n=1 Tax=Sphingomonas sp. KRR8 TaxID=2942996 RepID=UPI002020543C|nr:exopolysaccharide biosynthesis polyprenyl glycosylphosphotransferase [Sphingomonas sp. KRR8]URD61537.1 exopolysaccharide biosynthesis polyprenyl glycosylphosphotransferase [Sphingomonas sp. KRR8]